MAGGQGYEYFLTAFAVLPILVPMGTFTAAMAAPRLYRQSAAVRPAARASCTRVKMHFLAVEFRWRAGPVRSGKRNPIQQSNQGVSS
jgi:hypothetical protein